MTDLINAALLRYAEQHTSPPPPLLARIDRDTHANVLMPRMLSGHMQGRWLSMVSHLLRPTSVLEVGTYTGYSALCLAEGLAPGGKIITIDKNEELETRVRNYFAQAGRTDAIDFRIGDARLLIPSLTEMFDLVFIDADKESNALYYDLVFDKVRPGGFILIDNVLWSGKVLSPQPDKDTRSILAFNDKVHNDARVAHLLLPLRDGIMMVRKL
jgi:predicted O-methyltransferase YrrM